MMGIRAQNLTDGKLPTWRHGRAWLGRFRAEWCVFYHPHLALIFRKGGHVDDGSGIQLHVGLLLFSLYLTFNTKRSLKHRELGASWHDGSLWLNLWTADDDWVKARPWHRNTVCLHVVRWIVGREQHGSTKGEPFERLIPMPEGCYLAIFTPTTRTWKNRFRTLTKVGYDIQIPDGIPFEGKGENSWDCGEDALYGTGCGESVEEGIARVVQTVLEHRRRYGCPSSVSPVMSPRCSLMDSTE